MHAWCVLTALSFRVQPRASAAVLRGGSLATYAREVKTNRGGEMLAAKGQLSSAKAAVGLASAEAAVEGILVATVER
jgi:hypothetical protein